MPATEAQILANRANSLKSTGPRTPEGKASSRANAYKHGMTGGGVVLPAREAVEVERRRVGFAEEFGSYSESGQALARLAATMSVRAERCAVHENAALADRARAALAEFEAPDGLDPSEVQRLRAEAEARAMFDPSPEAASARKYEATAVRNFLRALKELQKLRDRGDDENELEAEPEEAGGELASFSPEEMTFEEFDALYAEVIRETPGGPVDPVDFSSLGGRVDVPMTIGRRR